MNTAVGSNTLRAVYERAWEGTDHHDGNTAIGYSAGKEGAWNIAIGVNVGTNLTGNTNTFIGKNAGYTVTSGSNNLMIGAAALPSSNTGNYSRLARLRHLGAEIRSEGRYHAALA